MMSRFDFFEKGYGLVGAKMGIISIDLLIKYDSYKVYRELIDEGVKESQAKIIASDRCNCHPSTIARYIYWFERDDVFANT